MVRETVELVDGRVYVSDDHWVTIYRAGRSRPLTDKAEADLIRYIAAVQFGGGAEGGFANRNDNIIKDKRK